ncbi:MAG: hypothetical protein AAGC88_01105 [Bacteroidota bacterium]
MNNQRSSEPGIQHPLPWFQNKILWLCGIYALIVATIILRVNVESTQYITPDSEYYLRVADNLLAGRGFVMPYMTYPFDENTPQKELIIWPIGYPALISLLSFCTGLDTLWASKAINLLALAGIFWLLAMMFKTNAWFVSLIFLSYGKMEVFSYTWSEGSFLMLELLLCLIVIKSLSSEKVKLLWLQITLVLTGLFLLRYAGLIFFFFSAFVMIYLHQRNKKGHSIHYFIALLLSSVFVLAYFYRNYTISGFYTGGDRVYPYIESIGYFFWLFLRGLFNELMLARNYFFKGNFDPLFVGLLLIQLLVVFQLFRHRHLIKDGVKQHTNLMVLAVCGLTYLVGIIIIRKIQPFDPFDFRILAPYSMPLFIPFFAVLTLPKNGAFYRKTSPWIIGFMAICWMMNLPKQFLVDLIVK